jgi:hypothetical protein
MRQYAHNFVRNLLVIILTALLLNTSSFAQEFDQYGGWTGLQGHNTSGYFRVEKINGRYWLVTPDNNVFWSIGHCVTLYNDTWGGYCPVLGYYPNPYGNKAKYNGNQSAWIAAVQSRNAAWGFNTTAAWGLSSIPGYPECVRVLGMNDRAIAIGCRSVGGVFADVFDPKFEQACDDRAKTLASNATNKWTIGSFPDNELRWANPPGYKTLVDGYIAFPPEAYGKQYWVNTFLKGKYATIQNLNTAYGTSFTSWDDVLACTSLPDDPNYPARLNDKIDFMEVIADQYYRIATSKMRQYDPNHLVFSARWAMWYNGYASEYHRPFNERVWKKAGEYCDIFANNGYADFGYAEAQFQHISRVFQNAKKPIMITEHSYLANDSYFKDTPTWLPTQMDRAISHVNHLKTLLDLGVASDPNDGQPAKVIMGLHWFQYYDEPSLGRPDGEAGQFGLLNVKDEAFTPLVDVMGTAHKQIYNYAGLGQPFVIPEAPTAVRPTVSTVEVGEKASSFEYVYYPDDSALKHSTGTLVNDPEATNGKAWKGTAGTGANQYIQYGPYAFGTTLWPSSLCVVKFRLKTNNNTTSSYIATIDATTNYGATVHASRQIRGTDFTAPNVYQDFSISFTTPSAPMPDNWEFRIYFTGVADLWIDTTTITFTQNNYWSIGPISDSKDSTAWWSKGYSSSDSTEWVAVDLGAVREGIKNAYVVPGSTLPAGMPIDFRLEYSIDGNTWNLIPGQIYTGVTNTGCVKEFSFAPITARYLRLYATKLGADSTGKYRLQLRGFGVRQVTGTATPTFEWQAVPNAASYTLLYSPEQGFPDEQTIRIDGITSTSYTPTVGLSPGPWYWTVKAVDAQGRGGHYLKTIPFYVGDLPFSQVDPILNLRGEQVTAWAITDNGVTGGDGTVWVFRDTARKVEGDSSIRMVFTVNSLNKTTGQKNTGVSNIPCRWVGPTMDYSGVSTFTFKLYPQRFVDTSGAIISPSKYLRFKMVDKNAGTVVDVPVDPAGTLPKDTWSTVSIPLGNAVRTHVSEIIFYINCGDTKLTWDERMIFNIDDMTVGVMRDRTPPDPPTVSDEGDYSTSLNSLSASWHATDPESEVVEYEYAIGTAPGAADIVSWTLVGNQTSVTNSNLSLTTGSTYYFSVRAKNSEGLWSEIGCSDGVTAVPTRNLGNVHNNPNGTSVTIPCAIVTAGNNQFSSNFYIEALDRSSGIRVVSNTINARIGDLVSVSGKIQTYSGERVITYPTMTVLATGKPVPRPLYLNGREVGGESPNQYTPGTHQGIGLYNVGLLVTVSGTVTYVDTSAKYFYIDDGSGRTDPSGNQGIKIVCSGLAPGNVIPLPAQGEHVLVTGVVATQTSSGVTIPVVRPRNAADVIIF